MSTTLTPPVGDARPRRNWLVRLLGVAVVCEWLIALGATAASIYLHVQNARWVGALWRDEAHTAAAAIRPSLGDVWRGLTTDNFPLLSTLIVRAWGWTAWGRSDDGLRALGAIIGIAILAALWWNGWRIHRSPPTIALALWAFNPVAIRFGDSVRPYGSGVLFQLLAGYSMARLAMAPSGRRFLAAALACTLSVQCLYQNAAYVLAFGLAGCAIAFRRRAIHQVVPVLAAGGVAALSLMPYIGPLSEARDWAPLMAAKIDFEQLQTAIKELLGGNHRAVLGVVLAIGATSFATALIRQLPRFYRLNREASEWSLFVVLSCALGSAAILWMLYSLSVQFQTWHALTVLAAVVFACDAVLGQKRWVSAARTAALLTIICLSWPSTIDHLRTRQTNLDVIASALEKAAAPQDLIVVQPWYMGVTFHRYYHGETPWTTLPEVSEIRVHRYDLLKRTMAKQGAIDPVMRRIAATLYAGRRVWIVGRLPYAPGGIKYRPTPRAPHRVIGWRTGPYLEMWKLEAAAVIDRIARERLMVEIPQAGQVAAEEKIDIEVLQGWKARE